jgi:putative glycerol-1-phosphate prenyltransferase
MTIHNELLRRRQQKLKSIAVLIDPDKAGDYQNLSTLLNICQENEVHWLLLGGSFLQDPDFNWLLNMIRENYSGKIILFPGNYSHINQNADGILFLSLISGRNPEYLIGQQVLAAPILKKSGLEVIPTGYLLIDPGHPTTVSYISNTLPIPSSKPEIAVATAIAGELLGLKLVYLDAGSGASNPVPLKMIKQVNQNLEVPLLVGGGLNTIEKSWSALEAGADLIVIGNALEKDQQFLIGISEKVNEYNRKYIKC